MDQLWKDARYAARLLVKHPGFTAVAVLSLGLGIGVNTTIFSIVNAVLLRPLPVERPGELVEIYTHGGAEFPFSTTSYPDYLDLCEQTADAFSGVVAHSMMLTYLRTEAGARPLLGAVVSGNFFDVLGVRPALGRAFLPEEDRVEGERPVTVVGHGFWQRELGGDPAAVGRTVRINRRDYTIVGVAPESFTGTVPGLSPELWIPMAMAEEVQPAGIEDVDPSPGDTRIQRRATRWLFVKARRKPGVSFEQARARVETVMARLEAQYPDTNENRPAHVLPASDVRLHPMIDGTLGPMAAALLGMVGLVLLVACANVANMLLARANARRREIAVRLALGAGRGRLVRQLLTESLLLASTGAAVGLLLTAWSTRVLATMPLPVPVPLELDFGQDARVLVFTAAIALATAVVFGLAPALRASRPDLVPALKDGAAAAAVRGRRLSAGNLLVVGQVAVSLVLLVGAALMVRSASVAEGLDLGFDADRTAHVRVDLSDQGYDQAAAERFYRELVDRLRARPGIEAAAITERLPLDVSIMRNEFFIPGHRARPERAEFVIDVATVGPGYFETFGIPILQGRGFTDRDTPATPRAVIVNETMARRFWPDESAVGKRIRRRGPDGPEYEIVGVSGDHKIVTVGETPLPLVLFAWSQDPGRFASVAVRASGDTATALAGAVAEMQAMDPDLVFFTTETMRQTIAVKLLPVRLGAALLLVFGAIALVLAAAGLYGVIAYSVSRRTREIGLRMALGARRAGVLGLVLRQGLGLTAVGVGIGLVGAAAAGNVLSSLLYGIGAIDPAAFALAAGLLAGVATLATWVPARRAARLDPIVALREE